MTQAALVVSDEGRTEPLTIPESGIGFFFLTVGRLRQPPVFLSALYRNKVRIRAMREKD